MTDTPTIPLQVAIPVETFEAVHVLTKRQNATLNNTVTRLLNEGIRATYERWPNLKEKPQ